MINRLRTSKESKDRLFKFNDIFKFSSNAVILRYAIARSINSEKSIFDDDDAQINDFSGFEITRDTLFGENEIVFKVLMSEKPIDDELFFPKLTNMHIERGLKLMEREYKLAGNKDKFFKNYIKKMEK